MLKIEAIIRPERLEAVKDALEAKGISSMTISSVEGRGRQKGITLEWRVGQYKVEFIPKVKLEIYCQSKDCDKIISAISETCRTGEIGDGKIFISEIKDAIRISTGERGSIAV